MAGPSIDDVPVRLRPAVRWVTAYSRYRGLRPADVVLASFPKSGSSWLRFVLADALTGGEIEFDLIARLSPPLGRQRGAAAILPGGGRLVKSHELPRFLPPSNRHPKVLHLVRDGRDVALSHYHQLLRQGRVTTDFDTFYPDFLAGRAGSYGSWRAFSRAWLTYWHRGGAVELVKYEDLLEDPTSALTRISEALGLGLTQPDIERAVTRNAADRMRAKEATSTKLRAKSLRADVPFVRAARAGTWRVRLTSAQIADFERLAGAELVDLGYPLSTSGSAA